MTYSLSMMGPPALQILRLEPEAFLPTKAYENDSGYDLYTVDHVLLPANEVTKVHTGIAIAFPPGVWGLIRDRSSIATKQGLFVVAGVVDNGYRNEILVALYNSRGAQRLTPGLKIAQLILMPLIINGIEEVAAFKNETERNLHGFGSSGT